MRTNFARINHVVAKWLPICCVASLASYAFAMCVVWVVTHQRRMAQLTDCNSNLCAIGLMLLEFHQKYGHFPATYSVDSAGRPMHSWRVLILEFSSASDIPYDFNEPWDSPKNIRLAERIPRFFI